MGITVEWRKRPDQEKWEGDIGNWRLEVEQNSDGDWWWLFYSCSNHMGVSEVRGTAKTFELAKQNAKRWVMRVTKPQ